MEKKTEKKSPALKKQLEEGRTQLLALRDEIRLHVHLGGMDLRDRWAELEPRVAEAERYAGEVTEASRAAMQDLVKRFRELSDALARVRRQQQVGRHAE